MRVHAWYRALLLAGLLLAVALALISVHLRLVNSGLGCTDWPDCYGNLARSAEFGTAGPFKELAVRAHRVLASVLGLLVLAVLALSLWLRVLRVPAGLLFGVMLLLAALGRWSAGLNLPGIVMANFAGGLLMIALLWFLWRSFFTAEPAPAATVHRLAGIATVMLSIQMGLGGLMSAFFAGLACGPAFDCAAPWSPGIPLEVLSGLFRPLELDATGRVLISSDLAGLHMTHRMLGFALVPVFCALAYLLARSRRRALAVTMLALTVLSGLGGVMTVRLALPPLMVLAHYAIALGLLLTALSAWHTGSAACDQTGSTRAAQ
jgi:cytochrome c oxidase assembly protein subunit 15